MTTPHKARNFRLRPGEPLTRGNPDPDLPQAETDILADAAAPGTAPPGPAETLAAIRAEGLTGRQLRMARRVAQKNGIAAESDYEAVLKLRRRGIDPFRMTGVVDLVAAPGEPGPAVQLPQTAPGRLPAPRVLNEEQRASEIRKVQHDIIRRRRRNFVLLGARLAIFVLLPTLIAGWYYFQMATRMYATKSEFVITKAESMAASGLGGLFQGTQFATSQDSIAVQGYLQSRDALIRLDGELGYKALFSQPSIDPVQRLPEGASDEAAYKLYRRQVKIGYDPTEGIIKMEVIAPDPASSQSISEALIRYAEERVDHLTQRVREDQMKGARDSFADAETKVASAQARVLTLQQQLGVLDPLSESNVVMSQVSTFEIELQKKRLELQQLLDNAQPNKARVEGAKGDIARLEALIAQLRTKLTENTAGSESLAEITGQLRIAEADLETRQLMLGQAMQQLETARIEADRQTRYLSVSVRPIAPDVPTYPRAFENTVLAFLIFAGIYLMISLTASILREQVAA